MIIHVENTFRAMTCEMCEQDFKKILKIKKHIKRQHERFLIPRQGYKYFRNHLQKEKVYLIGQFPSSPTYLVKNLRPTVLWSKYEQEWRLIIGATLFPILIHRPRDVGTIA